MTEQDIIKKNALGKLDELVKGSLNYLKDNNMTLDQFSIKVDNFFSNEEFLEIRNCLKQLLSLKRLFFIAITGILTPLLLKSTKK